MARSALVPIDTANGFARRPTMYFAGLLTVASAFLLTTESALAQKVLPSTLAKTVKVENFGPRDTAPFTLLSVSPVEVRVARHGPSHLPEMTFTFFAEQPLRSIEALPVRIPGGVAAPTYGSSNVAIGSTGIYVCKPAMIGGVSYPPKPEPDPPPRYAAGFHHCTWPLRPLYDAIYDPAANEPKLKAGDRVGFLLSIWGPGATPETETYSLVIVTVPVKSADTHVRRPP